MKHLRILFVTLCVGLALFLAHIYVENLVDTQKMNRIAELEKEVAALKGEKQLADKEIYDTTMKLLHCQGPGMKLEGIEDVTQK